MLTAIGIYFVFIISTVPMGEETTLFSETKLQRKYIHVIFTIFL